MNKKIQILLYIILDWVSSSISWYAFNWFRKSYIETHKHGYNLSLELDTKLLISLLIVPLFWLLIYFTSGFYRHIFRRSRLRELHYTLGSSFFGILIMFFAIILDDSVASYSDYYLSIGFYFGIHFLFTLVLRLILTSRTIKRIQKRIWFYPTAVIGTGPKAQSLIAELNAARYSEGFKILGNIQLPNATIYSNCNVIGSFSQIVSTLQTLKIHDVLIAIEDNERENLTAILDKLQNTYTHVKIIPDTHTISMGMVKMNNILGAKLADIDFEVMPYWQKVVKRMFDILFSLFALICLFPIMVIIAIIVKLDSKGPVFFSQTRIGLKGKPFKIYKFRSMRVNAELNGPQLSQENDPRHTKSGNFLRKTRLDELPQFFNVLINDMSLVGPRPERQFFIDLIVEKAPIYTRLHRVKPGITSWGQVKYGYASNVDEMLTRMQYDILYLENMSIGLDIKICIYTAIIMVQGRGK